MSLATTQMLSQQLATLTARQSILQMQLDDMKGAASDPDPSAEDSTRAEAELAMRIEANLRKSVRAALSGDVRDAIQRERQTVEDKIVQSVTAVSDDLAAEQQRLEESVKSHAASISSLEGSVAALLKRVEAAEAKLAE